MTASLFERAGYGELSGSVALSDDRRPRIECVLITRAEVARYVGEGVLDAGITASTGCRRASRACGSWPTCAIRRRSFRPTRWVARRAETPPIKGPKDLAGKRIATEAVTW